MGKPTGFMEFGRLSESYLPVAERVKKADYSFSLAPNFRDALLR